MQTQCPHCQTIFSITQQHLNLADGLVRCSQCQETFDGYMGMIDEDGRAGKPPELNEVVSTNANGNRTDIDPNRPKTAASLIYSDLLEDDYHKPRWKSIVAKLFWGALSLIAAAAVLLQVVYIKRAELVEHPKYGYYVRLACDRFSEHCSIPVKRALEQIRIDNRDVYSHPNYQNALVISATFSNRADFSQPYPTLVVSMSNVRGQEVAARLFEPTEYLKDQNIEEGLAPQESVSFSLEIQDPGEEAIAFELDFM